MYHWRTPVLPAAIAVAFFLPSPALAFSTGAVGGWNGSVASSGNNCMTCHGTRAGSGSVTVSGAPTTYSFNQIYNLTVRVADPDQLGAGFQISVEDALGNHVGALIITDPVNTQPAPGDPGWVTHRSAGVTNAVAGWAALGNAAEFNLQWQAPAADVGEIMFYLAGNAINNDGIAIDDDHVKFGEQDTIYLDAQSATAADTCGDGKQNNGEAGIDCGGPCPDCECLDPTDCDASLFCNGAEDCIAGNCVAGTPPNCDDGVGCTDDSCNEGTDSCDNTANNANCDDGLFCNGSETCDPVLDCQSGTAPNCDDGVGCTDDSCNEGTDSCDNAANNGNCDDSLFCNGVENCDPVLDCQSGTPINCDDGDDCTEDQCAADACVNDTIPNCCTADDDCDDGVFCNGAEACQGDQCESGSGPCPGQRCDEATEACVDCQVDTDCDDGNPCTDDVCAGGACIHDDNEVECDDGDACTAADQCVNGVCAGILVEECCATADECDDGDECTEDTCDTNACRHDPIPDCPASNDDDEPPPGDDDMPDPTGSGSQQPVPDDDSPTSPPPRRALCGLFGMITFPVLILGLIGMRSRRRRITIVGLRRRS